MKRILNKNEMVKILYELMQETVNEGIKKDETTKIFSPEEFIDFENNYRLVGEIFGLNFIEKIVNNFVLKEYKEEK